MFLPNHWSVYVLECMDGSYYIGMTFLLEQRMEQHSFHGVGYTAGHIPKKIVYVEQYDTFEMARAREIQLKGWSRMKKEKLIKGEWGKWE